VRAAMAVMWCSLRVVVPSFELYTYLMHYIMIEYMYVLLHEAQNDKKAHLHVRRSLSRRKADAGQDFPFLQLLQEVITEVIDGQSAL
jgi:hypothetical protein